MAQKTPIEMVLDAPPEFTRCVWVRSDVGIVVPLNTCAIIDIPKEVLGRLQWTREHSNEAWVLNI